ncbi:MAG: L,D-transpeptidase [Pseudomonadota bacterium]|jgi:hypothetical protein
MRRTAGFASGLATIGLVTAFALFAASAARAAVNITIDKNTQQMTVAVDGVPKYTWPVSSGLPNYETPNGSFKAFRMEEDHYSKEWDDAPMPHSIFFTKNGHAIHGTDSVKRLGNPASHGCVRLSRANAATLFALVKQHGVLNTTVTLSGSSQIALARRKSVPDATIARREMPGRPVELAPVQRGIASADGTVIYPREDYGYNDAARPVYPSQQRVYRQREDARVYGGQAYGSQTYAGDELYFDGYSWRRGQPGYDQPQYAPRPYYGPRY